MLKDAGEYYESAISKEAGFWPAHYRLVSLTANGKNKNGVQHIHRIRQALESIGQGQECGYEVFIGGFSPALCRQVLEKQLAEVI
jgi:hypothetical protein